MFSHTFRRASILTSALVFASLAVPFAPAQDWAKAKLNQSRRHGEYVQIPEAGGRTLQAFVTYPEVSGKAPVVVLIHEIFGLSDWMKLQADELAAAGYIVVAPDLLSEFGPPPAAGGMGSGGAGEDHAHMQMGGPTGSGFVALKPGGVGAFPDQSAVVHAVTTLDPAVVTGDLNAAADYGKHLPAASGKLAVAGFCWGGGKSFDFATHRADLNAAMVFYGTPPAASAMSSIAAPVFGFYAGNDARVTSTVPQATTDMKAAGKKYEPVIYAGAGHGFMRAGQAPDATPADKKAFEEAFERMVKELKKLK